MKAYSHRAAMGRVTQELAAADEARIGDGALLWF